MERLAASHAHRFEDEVDFRLDSAAQCRTCKSSVSVPLNINVGKLSHQTHSHGNTSKLETKPAST